MEIKTAEQLQLKLTEWDKQSYSGLWLKRKWVAVNDIHKKIAEILTIADENAMFQAFFELQKELLKSLSTTDSKES